MIPKWRRYLRFWRADPAADVDDELRTHLELRTDELRARGLSQVEAHVQALAEFGDVEATRARLVSIDRRMTRRRARFLWWDALRADLRYAARGLGANPLLAGTVVLTLAVGIGAATTMYGVMRELLVQPPPHVAAPGRVAKLYFGLQRADDSLRTFDASSFPFYERLRDQARTLAGVAAYAPGERLAVGQGADAELARATLVSAGFWRTLGVTPRLGRTFVDEEAHPVTGARVVVLGHELWQRRFGGDPAVVGRTLVVKGLPYEIVGVAPRGFRGIALERTDLWLPLFARADGGSRAPTWHESPSSANLRFVARLAQDASPAQARADLGRLYATHVAETWGDREGPSTRALVRLGPVTGALGTDMRRVPEGTIAVWLVGVAGVLLLVACANVGGLLLLRALRRRREIAVRLALGMSRRRLTALLFTETALLVVLGGAASAVATVWGGAWVRAVLLGDLRVERAGTDWWTIGAAVACTAGTALLAGLAPVLQARRDASAGLRDGGQHGATRRSPIFRTLLVAQTALSVVLLVGAGLFVRSIQRIESLDLGLDVRDALLVQVDFSGTGRDGRERAAFLERALERVRVLPGVTAASLAGGAPLHSASGGSFRLPGATEPVTMPDGAVPWMNVVGGDFFAATGMRVLEGRGLTTADRTGPPALVVNQSLARRAWPGRSPVGECVLLYSHPDLCATVVGVVADARTFRLREEQRPWFYTPLPPGDADARVLLVRRDPRVAGLEATVRQALHDLDPALPFVDVRVLGDALDPQMRPWRLGATVFTAFGTLAALLAALGLYAAVAYAVTQRTREIGVRVAVGATAPQVVGLVLGDGVRTALAGVALGLALALIGGRWMADLLFDVSPRDPLVLALVAGGALLAALAASVAPARRATRVDPVVALRVE